MARTLPDMAFVECEILAIEVEGGGQERNGRCINR
jgi:hypothetical protein